jgi:hypothetical protein
MFRKVFLEGSKMEVIKSFFMNAIMAFVTSVEALVDQ